MGSIQDSYLGYEVAGDQYVGRVASGLPLYSPKFAALPPQFKCTCQDDRRAVERIVKTTFPHTPLHTSCVMIFFAASLLYHANTLDTILPKNSPFHLSTISLSPFYHHAKKLVGVNFDWEDGIEIVKLSQPHEEKEEVNININTSQHEDHFDNTIKKATGIPMHTILLSDLHIVIKKQENLITNLRTVISEELDKQELGSTDFLVRERFTELFTEFESKVMDKISASDKNTNSESHVSSSTLQPRIGTHFWSGKFRRVPETWDFPMKMTLNTAWSRYHLIDHKHNLCATKHLTGTDVYEVRRGRRKLCDYRKLMHYMIDEAKRLNCYVDNPDEDQVQSMYEKICNCVFKLSKDPRCEHFLWSTHEKSLRKFLKQSKNSNGA